jgi:hypothetical protein
MGGGLLQLVAYGAQDIYLTGNPQMTFFKVVYRRHTNFAMEAIEQSYSGTVGVGNRISTTISRNGDLIGPIYLEMNVSATGLETSLSTSIRRLGYKLLDYVELEIGGQIIDKHYGIWMDIWNQLSNSKEQRLKINRMLDGDLHGGPNGEKGHIYVPLLFWFCRNPGLYLPLIALQYHEVKLNIQFNYNDSFPTSYDGADVETVKIEDLYIYCDYIFLDTDERRRFAQVSHEYLIEQVQFSNTSNVACSSTGRTNQVELHFNHPCKEMIWILQSADNDNTYYYGGGSDGSEDYVQSALIKLNGQDRFKEREGTYFRCVQPYQHHTGGDQQQPSSLTIPVDSESEETGFIYVYSFALKPEEHQPSGTCNFSRIDNAVLILNLNDPTVTSLACRIYVTNYNVLRIMSGMGGLAYSN